MSIYKINPTYYRITWNQTSPTNYSGLTGSRAGGLDSTSPSVYNRRVSLTGTVSITSTPLTTGDSMFVNGREIIFSSADNLAAILEKINLQSLLTNVIAHNDVGATYVTITNALGDEGTYIELAEGTGALAKLGFTAGTYAFYPCVVGGAFTNFTNNDTFTINGITVTMTTAGGLNQAGAVSTINALTTQTGVVAVRAASTVQLISVNNQPWTTSGANASKLGFPAGIYGGNPSTYAQSTNKALANLRWQQVINQLEIFSTPFMLNDQFGTGNYDGSTELDTFAFTVGYEHPDQVFTTELEGEPDPGNVLSGTGAIKRAVARGLVATYRTGVNLFDPTTETRGSYAIRANPVRVVKLTADGIDTLDNIGTVEGNITVTMIAYS